MYNFYDGGEGVGEEEEDGMEVCLFFFVFIFANMMTTPNDADGAFS